MEMLWKFILILVKLGASLLTSSFNSLLLALTRNLILVSLFKMTKMAA